jgi:glutathione peroxidase
MTFRQKITKFLYPIIMKLTKKDKTKAKVLSNEENVSAPISFYSLTAINNKGQEVSMNQYQGKKTVVVNVASNCGYTSQYDALERVYEKKKNSLVILGFPANDFGGQEPGSDQEIDSFCRINFGVSFPLFKKSSVLEPDKNEVFSWLTDPSKNGWNSQTPIWNFCKYVIDEKGNLAGFYGSAVDPESDQFTKVIQ